MLAKLRKLVLVEQTLFGLPWALIGALFAWGQVGFENVARDGLLILLAFTCARTSGMSFNRLIDRSIDAVNPRTQNRPLQTGEVSVSQVAVLAGVTWIGFLAICYWINTLCFQWAICPALLIILYSYSKRFTAYCHLFLGLIEFFAPIMAWVTVGESITITPLLLGIAMCFWLTGMDIIYSLQDIEFDRSWRLHSAAVALGAKRAFFLARVLHGMCLVCLIAAGTVVKTGPLFFSGVAISAIFFAYQHRLISAGQIKRAFYFTNVLITMTLFLFTLLDVLWRAIL